MMNDMRVVVLVGSVVVLSLGLLLVGSRVEVGWLLSLAGVAGVATYLWSLAMRITLRWDRSTPGPGWDGSGWADAHGPGAGRNVLSGRPGRTPPST